MRNRIRLVILILAVPLIGLAVAKARQAKDSSEIRSVIRDRYPNVDPAVIAQITLDRLCETPQPGLRDMCKTNINLNRLIIGALTAAAVGVALLLVIGIAGRLSRKRRSLLLYLFQAWPISHRNDSDHIDCATRYHRYKRNPLCAYCYWDHCRYRTRRDRRRHRHSVECILFDKGGSNFRYWHELISWGSPPALESHRSDRRST